MQLSVQSMGPQQQCQFQEQVQRAALQGLQQPQQSQMRQPGPIQQLLELQQADSPQVDTAVLIQRWRLLQQLLQPSTQPPTQSPAQPAVQQQQAVLLACSQYQQQQLQQVHTADQLLMGPQQAAAAWAAQVHGAVPCSGIAGGTTASMGGMQQQPGLYAAALARGQAIMAHNWQAATNKQRDTAWAQFETWSWQQLGKPGQQCHPNDIVVYLESSYLRNHGRQTAADGSSCPAPSTVGSTVAHLSTRFQELGCRGVWDWVTCTGNPCNSMELRTFKGGYANEMQDLGFTPTAAKPISEAKLQQLVQQLSAEAQAAQQQAHQPWYVPALLWRDACIAQYLWDSKRRPAELGQTQTAHVEVSSSAACDSRVLATPLVSKMCHASRGGRVPKPVDVQGAAGQQLAHLLVQYMQCMQQSGRALGRYLFSPLHPSKQMLQADQGLSTAAMGQRVIGHLKRLGLYEGESLYSIKRGAMQHDFFVAGKSLQAIGAAADIETLAVVQAYVDPTRHL